jgi:predicted nucleic acid-binding protein
MGSVVSEYVLDTVILVDALMGVEQAKRELLARRRNWISRITWTEVMAGASADGDDETENFLRFFSVIEVSEEIGRRAALISSQNAIKLPDAIIWASAQTTGRILVTRNTRDFPAKLPGIRVPYTL